MPDDQMGDLPPRSRLGGLVDMTVSQGDVRRGGVLVKLT